MVKNEAPTSICTFSTLFFIHSLWYCFREFVLTSQHFIFSDHFINSHDLSVWSGSVNCWEKLDLGHYWSLKGYTECTVKGLSGFIPQKIFDQLKDSFLPVSLCILAKKWRIWHKIRSHLGPFSTHLFIITITGNKGPPLLRESHSIC